MTTKAVVQMRKLAAPLGAVDKAVTRPVLRWHGGKWRLAPWILEHFPAAHTCYVEPFGGGANVLLRKARLAAECYNDLDGTVVNVFRVLRDPLSAAELARRLRLTPYARAEFEWSYEPAGDAIDAAHKVIVRSFMGFGSDSVTRGCKTGFRGRMTDTRAFASAAWRNYVADCDAFHARLQGVVIECVPALELMARYDTPATLFYCDPPYLHATRSSLKGRSGVGEGTSTHGYAHEMSIAQHKTMLAAAKRVTGHVVLSGYPSALYDGALKGWRRVERQALADGARERTEVLWINPRCAAALDAEAAARRAPDLFTEPMAAE